MTLPKPSEISAIRRRRKERMKISLSSASFAINLRNAFALSSKVDLPLCGIKAGTFIPSLYVSECTGEGSEDLVQLREESRSMRFNPRGGHFESKSIRSKK
jgi:hypothetical protein